MHFATHSRLEKRKFTLDILYLLVYGRCGRCITDDIMRQQTQFKLHLIFVIFFLSGFGWTKRHRNERIECEIIFVCSAHSVPTVKHSIWAALFDTHENI